MKRVFDAVISLGNQCGVAAQIQRKGLRTSSGPVDWFDTTNDGAFLSLLENRFSDFMELENLRVIGRYERDENRGTTLIIKDIKYDTLSKHDILYKGKDNIGTDEYKKLKERTDRRAKRFLDQVDKLGSILFIRRGMGREHFVSLCRLLEKMRRGKDFHLIAVMSKGEYERSRDMASDRISIFYEEKPSDENFWKLDDAEWDIILKDIGLSVEIRPGPLGKLLNLVKNIND